MSRPTPEPPSMARALLQMVTKVTYEYVIQSAKHRRCKLRFVSCDASEADACKLAFAQEDAARDATRDIAVNLLRICAALPPVRRRQIWSSMRNAWRLGRTVAALKGGAR